VNPDLAELEHMLAVAAYIVVRHGEAYVPVLDRLEREVEQERHKVSNRERAQRILANAMKRGVTNVPAG